MNSTSLDAAILESCVSAAVAAPSIHNAQPWRFRLEAETGTLQVRVAPVRGLRYTDPTARALHLSVGACVLNLRVALAHFGLRAETHLLPCPQDPGLFATVHPAEHPYGPREQPYAGLYEAIRRRHSSRLPFSDRPLPAHVREQLVAAARSDGAWLGFPETAETRRLLRLTAEAEQRNRLDADRATESRRWVHQELGPAPDRGLPRAALGPQDAREYLPLRDFTAQRHAELLPAQPFEAAPVVAVLNTEHDRRTDWLGAGQALQHVWLVATAHGLRASLLHQALEWPDLRRSLNPDHTGHAQILIRLGYGPVGAASPRRAQSLELDTEPRPRRSR